MFEDATFSSRGILPSQAPKWMLATLAFNLTLLTAMVIVPLLHPDSLPHSILTRTIFTPPPPPSAAQPAHRQVQPTTVTTISLHDPFLPPRQTPSSIDTTPDAPPSIGDVNLSSGSVSGSDGPPTLFHPDPPPVVKPAPSQPKSIRLSTVSESQILSKPAPIYPPIALASHTSGTVVLSATISTTGTIKNLRVQSGNTMLTNAALTAVQNWRYRPFLLNNQPVEVETTINVVFSLGNR